MTTTPVETASGIIETIRIRHHRIGASASPRCYAKRRALVVRPLSREGPPRPPGMTEVSVGNIGPTMTAAGRDAAGVWRL